MSELTSMARPYARAAFEWADSHSTLDAWAEELAFLGRVVEDERVHRILADPRVDRGTKAEMLLEIGTDRLTDPVRNFLRLLADNGRLLNIPAIHAEFAALKAATEKRIVADVISFQPLTEDQEQVLLSALGNRLGCAIELSCSVDESLLGGVVVRAGDLVIDGSVRGHLTRLAANLSR